MYYGLLYETNGMGESMASVYCGKTIREMMSGIINRCTDAIDLFTSDDITRDDVLSEEDDGYFDDYIDYMNGEVFSLERVNQFSFQISDMNFYICCAVKSYNELVTGYADFSKDMLRYSDFEMVPGFKGTPEEIRELNDEIFGIMEYDNEWKYFREKPEE